MTEAVRGGAGQRAAPVPGELGQAVELELPLRPVAAAEIDATEQKFRKLLDAGKSLAEAQQELGYHSPQARRK